MTNRMTQRGLGLIDLMATLVVICGVIAAVAYYRGRVADDPKKIDTSLPNFAAVSPHASGTAYYLEGNVHRVTHNESGTYFLLKAANGHEYWVVGEKTTSGGISNAAAGQVAMMQVHANTGASLTASLRVVPTSIAPEAFVYKYMVKTPAPANYKDPLEPVEEAAPAADPTAPVAQPRDKDED